ncbi:hypothetical protein [Hyphococcus sp.]|uniref:hypothetical protein n=1 Tax=Hyphococcus sp. TaxID=2038636 RepID=UPI0020821F09|nr:MAG: hypothetical protein DHS20C04_16680 [Marinicaulis sp.]
MSIPLSGAEPAASPASRVQSLIDITDALSLIFDEENTALEARRPYDAASLQAEKARLAAAYAQSIRDVAADRAGVSTVEGSLLLRLREITSVFETRAARQRSLLENMENVPPALA